MIYYFYSSNILILDNKQTIFYNIILIGIIIFNTQLHVLHNTIHIT